jgi:hypothetical protein
MSSSTSSSNIVSSIKPDTEAQQQAQKSMIEINDETYQSYIKEGFEENIPHSVEAPHTRLMKFIAEAEGRPILRTVTKIERVRNSTTGFKEHLVYWENLEGTTWAGDTVRYTDHVWGYHKKQVRGPRINEKKQVVEYIRTGEREVYTIPYTKEKVDELIENSDGSDRDSIKLFIKNPNGTQSADFHYQEFIMSWNDCINMLLQPGGPMAYHVNRIMETQGPGRFQKLTRQSNNNNSSSNNTSNAI